jgi:hypothetical protein
MQVNQGHTFPILKDNSRICSKDISFQLPCFKQKTKVSTQESLQVYNTIT